MDVKVPAGNAAKETEKGRQTRLDEENANVQDENVNTLNSESEQKLKKIQYEIGKNMKKHEEYQYLNLVLECILEGNKKLDRTKIGTHSVFGRTMRYSLQDEVFPLLTTKATFFRGVAEELLFFISGKTEIIE